MKAAANKNLCFQGCRSDAECPSQERAGRNMNVSWSRWMHNCLIFAACIYSGKVSAVINSPPTLKHTSNPSNALQTFNAVQDSTVTFWNTGLLLLTSSTCTITKAVLESARGPPEMLSSVAVTLRTYSGPWSFGGGLERRRIKPVKGKRLCF